MTERRNYERINVDEEIEYYAVQNRVQQFYKGIVVDISASGAKLITKHELNTKHQVILNTTFLNIPTDELAGKVVWKEKKSANKFFNGIHFEFKDQSVKEELIDVLY